MPIRLPNFAPSSSGRAPQGVSLSDATAPALALSRVGGAIGGIGQQLTNHVLELQEAENAADLTEFATEAKEVFAARKASFAEDHDYRTYGEKWDGDLSRLEESLSSKNLSPAAREKAQLFLKEFKGNSKISVAAEIQKKSIQRAKQAYANGMQTAIDAFDPTNPSDAPLEGLLGIQTWMTPEEKEAARQKYGDITARKSVFAAAHEDPKAWLENNQEPGNDPGLWSEGKRIAKARLRELTSKQTEDVLNGMASGSLKREDIEALTPDLSESARAELFDHFDKSLDEDYQRSLNTPEAQASLTGVAQQLIDGYDPEGDPEKFDADFVKIDSILRHLQPGATRDELNRRLDKIRAGEFHEVETRADAARAQLKKAFNDGVLGDQKEVETGSLGEILDDGFLSEKRLLRLGIDEKTAAFIASGGDDDTKPLDAFRAALAKNRAWAKNANWRENQIIEAIQGYKGKTTRIPKSPEQEAGANDPAANYGRATNELNQFLKLNPDASQERINSEIQSILGGTKAYNLQKSLLPSRPVAPSLPTVSQISNAHKRRSDIPYNGVPASVRYNNPLAAYPRQADTKYGLQGFGVLNGGKQGTHKIGRFPTPVHGAAANIDLLASKYKGLTLEKAIGRWRGNVGRGEKIVIPEGFSPSEVITDRFLANQDRASDFFKKMASHETGKGQALTDDEWKQAWQMWKQGGSA